MAVDAGHVYWANQTADTIGRANLDGTGVNQNFITGIDRINSVAVDDDHVYWTEWSTDSVGRANLDGTGINPNFITGPWAPIDVAVDDSHVYWSDRGGCWIGRANLDGTGVSLTLITPGSCTGGIALDSGPPLAPTADAGADYETVSGAIAFLDGSGSADPDDDPLDYSWTQTSGPAVTVNGADTALASFVAPTGPATLEFELEVCDGEPLCDTDRIVVTIEAAPPTAMDDQATVDENSGATTIDVLDNDLDPGGPLEITSVTQPENGTVVIAPDGLSLTYEPAPDYCNEPGEQPTDDFTYTLNGGSEATVAVTVTCAEDPPDAPTITATTPGSPANNNSPTVRGTLGAGNPTEVLIFATANCREPTLARATAAEFTGTGIAITVPDNTTTPLSAMAIGESYSGCSNTISYIEDSSPPNTLIDSGPKGLTNNPSPSFAFHSPQPGVSFECRLDPSAGGTWAPCSSPKGLHRPRPGPASLRGPRDRRGRQRRPEPSGSDLQRRHDSAQHPDRLRSCGPDQQSVAELCLPLAPARRELRVSSRPLRRRDLGSVQLAEGLHRPRPGPAPLRGPRDRRGRQHRPEPARAGVQRSALSARTGRPPD